MRLYQNILSVIPEGLAVLNSDKKLIYANPTLKKILQSNSREEIQQILMNLGNNQSNDNIDKSFKYTTTLIDKQQLKESFLQNKEKILQQNNTNQNDIQRKSKFNNKYHSLSDIQNKEINLPFQDQQDLKNTNSKITQKNSSKQIQIHQTNLQAQPSIENDINKQEGNYYSTFSSPIKKMSQQSKKNAIVFQKNTTLSKSNSHQIIEKIKSSKSIKKESRLNNINKVEFNSRFKQSILGQQRGQNTSSIQVNTEQSEILSYKGFGFDDLNKTISSKEINSQYFVQQPIPTGTYLHIANGEQNTFKSHSPLGIKKQFQLMSKNETSDLNDANSIPQILRKAMSQQVDSGFKERQLQFKENSQQNKQYNLKINDILQYNGTNNNSHSIISIQQIDQRVKEKTDLSNKKNPLNEIAKQEVQIRKLQESIQLKESIQKQKQQKQQLSPIKSKSLNPFSLNKSNFTRMKTQQYKDNNQEQNGQKQQNDPTQNNIPFSLKVKPKKSSSLKNDNQILLEKTDVSNIIDKILDESSIKQKTKKNINSQQIIEKNDSNQNDINKNAQYSNNLTVPQSDNFKNQQKDKTFFQQMQNQGEFDLSYIQHTDTLTKIQVINQKQNKNINFNSNFNYSNRQIIQFLVVDVFTDNSKKDPLILIMVQDLWQDLYQKKVQEKQKEKMRVFASLSHELRTPLNCSISMLEVLKDEIQAENQQYIEEYLNPALFSNKLLLNQINDILDFVQMDSGKFKYSYFDFNVMGLLKDCQKLVSLQAQMKKIELRTSLGENIPEVICSDPNRIRQIILNFLSNSLKFTKFGSIELGIVSIQNGLFQIFVKDTGIGIQKENLDQIFDFCAKINYESNDAELNRQGCGLGLTISNSIAKGLIKKQKSQGIQVESNYGQGSKFSIIIEDMNYNPQNNIPIITEQFSPNKNKGKVIIKNINSNEESSSNKYINKNTSSSNNNKKNAINLSYVITEDDNSIIDTQNNTQNPFNGNFDNRITLNKLRYTDNNQEVILSDNSGERSQKTKVQNSEFIDSAEISDDQEDIKKNNKIQQFQEIQQIPENIYFQQDDSQEVRSNSPTTYSQNKQHHLQAKIQQLNHNFPIKYDDINQSTNQQDQYNQFSSLTSNYAIDSQLFDQNSTTNKNNNKESNCFHHLSDIENNHQERYLISCIQEDKKEESEQSSPKLKLNVGTVLQANSRLNQQSSRNHVCDMKDIGSQFEQEGFTSYAGMQKQLDLVSIHNQSSSSQKIDLQKSIYSTKTKKQYFTSSKNECDFLVPQQVIDQIIEKNISKQLQCRCPQILIVDDNQFNIYALSKTVQQFQFIIDSATDGYETMEKVKQQFYSNCCKVPQIIFMDIDMPLKNGYQTAQDIHEFYQSKQVAVLPVIIACTAYVGQEDHAKAILAGMDDFINKPLLKKAFQDVLFNWKNIFI